MAQKKLTNRQINALETKESIYNAAIRLFKEKGFTNVLIEDITTAANTAKGNFYNYFTSKKDLLYHTFDKFDAYYIDAYEKVKEIPTFEERLLTFIELSYQQIDVAGKEIPKALYHMNMLDEDPLVVSDERILYQFVREMIELGIKNGELDSSKTVAYYLDKIKTQIVGIDYRWCVSSKNFDFSQYARDNINVVIKGLKNL